MVRRALAVGLCATWLVLPAGAALLGSPTVTPTKIAGVGLGLAPAAYQRALGEPPTRFSLPGNRAKLIFAKRELSVTLDSHGRGVAIETAALEYVTRGGAHPCGPLKVLAREFGRRLVEVREPTTGTVVAYRVGTLTFSIMMDKIGSIILSSPPVSASIAANSPHCGSGEEGE